MIAPENIEIQTEEYSYKEGTYTCKLQIKDRSEEEQTVYVVKGEYADKEDAPNFDEYIKKAFAKKAALAQITKI